MITFSSSIADRRSSIALMALLLIIGSSIAFSAKAETVPTTKCVTVATEKLRNAAQAQLEKDILPYAGNANAKAVITTYKEGLAIAWEAMEYPYCGMGSSGVNPAIKSYNKTVLRARMKFLTDIKTSKVTAKIEAKIEAKKEEVKKEVKKVEKIIAKNPVKMGLRLGQRSEQVKELQRRLVAHFKLTPESDYVTGYFGPTTRKYLIKYQLEKKLIKSEKEAGAGLVGPKTTAKFNAE